MATLVLNDAVVLWDGYDLSGDHNRIGLDYGAELLDSTTFGATTRTRVGGLKTVSINGAGYWQADSEDPQVDDVLYGRVGSGATVVTISADGGEEGEFAYSFQPIVGRYMIGGANGVLMPFDVTAQARGRLVRGTVMQNGAETSTGTGTARQLGAVTAAQKLYAALHILAVSGTDPTLTVVVRSDDNSGMTSATDRITFTEATAVGAQWATPVAGAITDTWWDIEYTIGGTDTPTFTFVVVVGIH